MKIFAVIFLVLSLSGCASKGMLPSSAAVVDFNGKEGKTGWSQYKHQEFFKGYSVDEVYQASKVGLGNAGFSLIEADKSIGRVVGEHGMTLHDWNVIAGVFFKEADEGVNTIVIIEGSKDTGISGDVTGDGWSGKILKEMRDYLRVTF